MIPLRADSAEPCSKVGGGRRVIIENCVTDFGGRSLLHARVEHPGFNSARLLDLHKQPVNARLRKAAGEKTPSRNGNRHAGRVHHASHHAVHWAGIGLREFARGHGYGTCRMDVREYTQIAAHKKCVSRHAHAGLEIGGRCSL